MPAQPTFRQAQGSTSLPPSPRPQRQPLTDSYYAEADSAEGFVTLPLSSQSRVLAEELISRVAAHPLQPSSSFGIGRPLFRSSFKPIRLSSDGRRQQRARRSSSSIAQSLSLSCPFPPSSLSPITLILLHPQQASAHKLYSRLPPADLPFHPSSQPPSPPPTR